MENYIVVIQAGGMGTRMKELTKDEIPKPLLSLNGKPMIQWQVETFVEYGIKKFIIIIGHLGNKIKEYFEDGRKYGVHISYIEENEPLGSAGALYYLKDKISTDNFILVLGDIMFKVDWNRMIAFHKRVSAEITLLSHPNSHPYDSDILLVDDDFKVIGIDLKNSIRGYWYENNVNAGIYIFNSQILTQLNKLKKMDLEKDLILPMIGQGKIYAYKSSEYVKDTGTPERFYEVCNEQIHGLWDNKCYDKKQRCIFLDRDGTVNKYNGLICNEEDFELEKCAAEAIKLINNSSYIAIIITNQSVVARGMCSIEKVNDIHRKLQTLLGQEGAYVDDIIFCPHHPDKGYPEENPDYKIVCECRKPAIGLIDKMVEKYNIDLSSSWMIGDSTVDIQTGKNAGMKTILVQTGLAGKDNKYKVNADYVNSDLLEAVKNILSLEKNND